MDTWEVTQGVPNKVTNMAKAKCLMPGPVIRTTVIYWKKKLFADLYIYVLTQLSYSKMGPVFLPAVQWLSRVFVLDLQLP